MNDMCAALRIIVTGFDIRAQRRQLAVVIVGVRKQAQRKVCWRTKGNNSIETIDRTRVTEASISRRSNWR